MLQHSTLPMVSRRKPRLTLFQAKTFTRLRSIRTKPPLSMRQALRIRRMKRRLHPQVPPSRSTALLKRLSIPPRRVSPPAARAKMPTAAPLLGMPSSDLGVSVLFGGDLQKRIVEYPVHLACLAIQAGEVFLYGCEVAAFGGAGQSGNRPVAG